MLKLNTEVMKEVDRRMKAEIAIIDVKRENKELEVLNDRLMKQLSLSTVCA